ncbi:reverse transcriptase domain-containing protein, partial [Tanacetum coccineum]
VNRGRPESPEYRNSEENTVFTRLGKKERGVFERLGEKRKNTFARLDDSLPPHQQNAEDEASTLHARTLSESEDSGRGDCKSKSKKQKSSTEEDDLSQPWLCEYVDSFTPRICNFKFPKKNRMPGNVITFDEFKDLEDHLKVFQAAAKVEQWAMPTWCHMFNSTLIGSTRLWFDELPPESIDSYDDLKKAFMANFLQQKKYIKDPVEIHHIKQREGS